MNFYISPLNVRVLYGNNAKKISYLLQFLWQESKYYAIQYLKKLIYSYMGN